MVLCRRHRQFGRVPDRSAGGVWDRDRRGSRRGAAAVDPQQGQPARFEWHEAAQSQVRAVLVYKLNDKPPRARDCVTLTHTRRTARTRSNDIPQGGANMMAEILIPRLQIISDYEVNGHVMLLPIQGKGPSNITLGNLFFKDLDTNI